MKSTYLNQMPDGRLKAGQIADNPRMDFALFQKVHGGRAATPAEIAESRTAGLPAGFSVWLDKRGSLMAVRDE